MFFGALEVLPEILKNLETVLRKNIRAFKPEARKFRFPEFQTGFFNFWAWKVHFWNFLLLELKSYFSQNISVPFSQNVRKVFSFSWENIKKSFRAVFFKQKT